MMQYLVSENDMVLLNDDVKRTIHSILVTLDTSLDDMLLLNDHHKLNILNMLVTLDASQYDMYY